jgi:peptidoglycan/xylan/chitin deacetylase (PgdA/CDA1 family)
MSAVTPNRPAAAVASAHVTHGEPRFMTRPGFREEMPEPAPEPPPPPPAYRDMPVNALVPLYIPVSRVPASAAVPNLSAGHSDSMTLTFDDCGSADQIEAVVKALAETHRQAIFFVTGMCRDHFPWLLDTLRAAGHQVCNHTYSHPNLLRLSNVQVRNEIAGGVNVGCPYFRPPYGAWDGPRGRIARIAAEFGLTPMLWDVDTRDWAGAPPEPMAAAARTRGGVILLHLHGIRTVEAVRLLGNN